MKPKLILIGGEAWTGRSTCAWILERIQGVEYDRLSFTLLADAATLTERARLRDAEANPCFLLLEATRGLANTVKINTAHQRPEAVAEAMAAIVLG